MTTLRPLRPRRPARAGQHGVTLIIALVMLVAMSLLAAWAVKSANVNLRIVGNTQARHQALSAAQAALETTLSAPTFAQEPAALAANPIPVDVDGDGLAELSATLTPAPTCYRVRPVKMAELDANKPADVPCLRSGAAANAGIESASLSSGDSLCADSEWNIRAVVNDPSTNARVALNQGVAVRGLITDAANGCP